MGCITLEIEAVTATFLHADPGGEASWRAPAFRGLARWWYRALLGASLTPEKVRDEEARVFGTAESPSKVTIRVMPVGPPRLGSIPINPGSPKSANSSAIQPRSRAVIEIRGGDDSLIRRAYVALWTALHLGGVGQRSRRGAGSLRVVASDAPDGMPKLPRNDRDPTSLAHDLQAGLALTRQILSLGSPGRGDINYPVLLGSHCVSCVTGAPWGGSELDVRRGLMDLRRKQPDHLGARKGKELEFGAINPRLSSPLWVRVASIDGKSSVLVMTLFKHGAATKLGAKWEAAESFMKAVGTCVPVAL